MSDSRIEDFEEVQRRRDQILELTKDLKVTDQQWIIDCLFAQMQLPDYEASLRQFDGDPDAQAQIAEAQAAINARLSEQQ